MSSAAVHIHTHRAEPALRLRSRILITRSCRALQFMAAVNVARRRHPHAEIVALSHRGHADALRAAGVDRVIEMPGRRFGILRIAPWQLARLRAEGFDEVIVPQMQAHPDLHMNVYWLVAALQPSSILVLPGDGTPQEYSLDIFVHAVRSRAFARAVPRLDSLVFAGVQAAAGVARRSWWHRRRRLIVRHRVQASPFDWHRAAARQRLLDVANVPFGALVMGFAGRLAHATDTTTFLDIVARVRAVRGDVHAVVIGDGPHRDALEQHADNLGLAVTFVGSRPNARQLAAGCDLLVMTAAGRRLAGERDAAGMRESFVPAADAHAGARVAIEALGAIPADRLPVTRRRPVVRDTPGRSTLARLDEYRRQVAARTVVPDVAAARPVAVRVSGTR